MNLFKRLAVALVLSLLFIQPSGAKKDKLPPFKPQFGPWVTNVTETSFTVLWTTEYDALVSLEVAPGDDGSEFESAERTSFVESVAGRRVTGRYHRITATGLEPGRVYRYRIVGQNVEDDSSAYGTTYGVKKTIQANHFIVSTIDVGKETCRFSMVNDMHHNLAKFSALMKDVNRDNCDFVVLNGDITSTSTSLDTTIRHTFEPIAVQCASMPVVYSRGNHEGRGREFYRLPWMCPTPTGEFYYLFRQGPVAAIVLDAGEDKPDSSSEYSGTAVYDEYRQVQLEWLKEIVKDPAFTSAPVKICIMHIPAINDRNSWYSQKWANKYFLPILNEAGIMAMFSGHHHKHFVREKGDCGNNFPIVVNSNNERMDFVTDKSGRINLKFYDVNGTLTHEYNY